MVLVALGESGVIQDHTRFRSFGDEVEANDGVHSVVPVLDAPGLDDALVRQQFNVATAEHAAEARECATGLAADLGRCARTELAELLGAGERLVHAAWSGIQDKLLANGS